VTNAQHTPAHTHYSPLKLMPQLLAWNMGVTISTVSAKQRSGQQHPGGRITTQPQESHLLHHLMMMPAGCLCTGRSTGKSTSGRLPGQACVHVNRRYMGAVPGCGSVSEGFAVSACMLGTAALTCPERQHVWRHCDECVQVVAAVGVQHALRGSTSTDTWQRYGILCRVLSQKQLLYSGGACRGAQQVCCSTYLGVACRARGVAQPAGCPLV
jgi:hypothetical protein